MLLAPRCEVDVAESRALVWLDTELLLQLRHLGPQCSRVSKLPRGIARAAAAVAESHIPILCLQPQEPRGALGRPARPQVTQPCRHPQGCDRPQQHCCLQSHSLQFPVTAAEISFAVFEQNIGGVLLHVLPFRKATGQMVKE